jgi:hypothetical protein
MPYAAESVLFTAAREAKKIWPALAGFGAVGFAVVKVTAGATPEARAATRLLRRAAAALAPPACGALHGIAAGCAARCVARNFRFLQARRAFPCAQAAVADRYCSRLCVRRTSRRPSSPTRTRATKRACCAAVQDREPALRERAHAGRLPPRPRVLLGVTHRCCHRAPLRARPIVCGPHYTSAAACRCRFAYEPRSLTRERREFSIIRGVTSPYAAASRASLPATHRVRATVVCASNSDPVFFQTAQHHLRFTRSHVIVRTRRAVLGEPEADSGNQLGTAGSADAAR